MEVSDVAGNPKLNTLCVETRNRFFGNVLSMQASPPTPGAIFDTAWAMGYAARANEPPAPPEPRTDVA